MKRAVVGGGPAKRAFVCLGLLLGTGCASAPVDSLPRAEARQQLASGASAIERRQFEAASAAFGRAALIFAALSEMGAETAALRDQAETLRRAGDLETAVAVSQRALALDRRLGHREDQAQDLGALARCAAAQQKTALAIQTAEDGLALADTGSSVAVVLDNDLALYLLTRGDGGDAARAIELLRSASASNQSRGDAQGVASNELNLGRAELALGDAEPAEAHLQRALEGFRALQDPEGLAETHEMLARLSLARHEREEMRFHREQARAGYELLEDRGGLRRLDGLVVP